MKAAFLGFLIAAGLAAPAAAVGPDDPEPTFARKFCAERKHPTDSVAYHPNGEIRASIACGVTGGYVSAQFYNEKGKLTRAEHPSPGLAGAHDVELYDYDASGTRLLRIRIFDANGTLLQTRDADPKVDRTPDSGVSPTASFEDYVDMCRKNAPYYQRFILGEVKPLEFDVDKACDCVARRLSTSDPTTLPGGATTLEQVDAIAMYEPKSCICPNAQPGSSLRKNCDQR